MPPEPPRNKFRLQAITWILIGTIVIVLMALVLPRLVNAQNWAHYLVFLIVVGLTLGLIEIRRLNSRLAHLAKTADSLGKGDYETRADVNGSDAVSLVGQGLNHMAERVADSIAQIEKSRDELARSQSRLTSQHEELSRSYERQARFGDYLAKLNSIDIDTLAQDSFQELVEAAKAQIGVLYLFDDSTQKLDLLVEYGIDREALRKLAPVNSFEGLPGEAFNRREWIMIDDIDPECLPEVNLGIGKARIRNIYAIPLVFQNKALGVVLLAGLHTSEDGTVQLLRNYTSALANALSNALTYQAVQRQTAQFEEANTRLLDIDQHRRQFVANVSHELRTPLNSIIGFSSILLKNRDGTLGQEDLGRAEKINRNGKHLLKLINDILDLSRIEAGRMETDFRPTQVDSLIREVADMLQPQVDSKNIELQVLVPEESVTISTDSDKLRQILINLANNAVKFTEKGHVRLQLYPPENAASMIAIEVADTGVGISQGKVERIFEAFQQADNTTSRKYGGTGLGLTISRTLLSLLGGRIDVSSRVGEGSLFRIEIPASEHGAPPDGQKQMAFDADDVLFPEESARLFQHGNPDGQAEPEIS